MQRLKEAAEKAKIALSSAQETEINLPFITADASGPSTSTPSCPARSSSRWSRTSSTAPSSPAEQALKDAGVKASEIDEVVLVGGQTRMPLHPEAGRRVLRQGAASGCEPGRGRRDRRGDPGRRARRRRQGRPAARRHPAVARYRDARRRDHQADRAQHHDPDAQERDLLDRGRQPDLGRGSRAPGRARDGQGQPDARPLPPGRAFRRRRAACRRSRSPSTSTPTASSTCRPRISAPARSSRSRITASSGLDESEIEKMVQDAESHASEDGRGAAQVDRGPQRARQPGLLDREERSDEHKEASSTTDDVSTLESAIEEAKKALEGDDTGADLEEAKAELSAGVAQAGRGDVPTAGAAAPGAELPGGAADGGAQAAADDET